MRRTQLSWISIGFLLAVTTVIAAVVLPAGAARGGEGTATMFKGNVDALIETHSRQNDLDADL
ncbi:MAG: hypothetical protein KJ687_00525, partial [Proteobacteria bacterium]|nr:hypothetical protein [Pseudomonadota bacterium]